MTDYKTRYTNFEKTCLAGKAEIEALHAVLPSTFNSFHGPTKKVFVRETRLNVTGRTARWLLLLSEFDITYVTKKEGRQQNTLHPIKEEHEFKDCFPDEEIAVTEEELKAT